MNNWTSIHAMLPDSGNVGNYFVIMFMFLLFCLQLMNVLYSVRCFVFVFCHANMHTINGHFFLFLFFFVYGTSVGGTYLSLEKSTNKPNPCSCEPVKCCRPIHVTRQWIVWVNLNLLLLYQIGVCFQESPKFQLEQTFFRCNFKTVLQLQLNNTDTTRSNQWQPISAPKQAISQFPNKIVQVKINQQMQSRSHLLEIPIHTLTYNDIRDGPYMT